MFFQLSRPTGDIVDVPVFVAVSGASIKDIPMKSFGTVTELEENSDSVTVLTGLGIPLLYMTI